jgi:3-keto-L-gulonate-6-phosphate decarboxylase
MPEDKLDSSLPHRLDNNVRYLQIAFNHDLAAARRILPKLPSSPRIVVEAGTPFIKQEGLHGVEQMRKLWKGSLVADLKTMDGAEGEVIMAHNAGANAVTVLGAAPPESLNLFIQACREREMLAMIDMIGVDDPLEVMRCLRQPPNVVVLHLGRDEESTRGKVIQYRHVNRIRSKYDVLISAAGGVTLKEARSAIFNGASIVVANLVQPGDPWQGISTSDDVAAIARQFLDTIA